MSDSDGKAAVTLVQSPVVLASVECSPVVQSHFKKLTCLIFFKLLKQARGETLFILFILLRSYSKAVLLPLVLLFPLSPKKDTPAPTTPAFRAQPEALCALSITLYCFCTHFNYIYNISFMRKVQSVTCIFSSDKVRKGLQV